MHQVLSTSLSHGVITDHKHKSIHPPAEHLVPQLQVLPFNNKHDHLLYVHCGEHVYPWTHPPPVMDKYIHNMYMCTCSTTWTHTRHGTPKQTKLSMAIFIPKRRTANTSKISSKAFWRYCDYRANLQIHTILDYSCAKFYMSVWGDRLTLFIFHTNRLGIILLWRSRQFAPLSDRSWLGTPWLHTLWYATKEADDCINGLIGTAKTSLAICELHVHVIHTNTTAQWLVLVVSGSCSTSTPTWLNGPSIGRGFREA